MKTHADCYIAFAALMTTLSPAVAFSQTAPATPSATPNEIVELSPFTVNNSKDRGYGALNSNSITSFSAELGKVPMSADVFTAAFMEDTNSTTLESMLRNY